MFFVVKSVYLLNYLLDLNENCLIGSSQCIIHFIQIHSRAGFNVEAGRIWLTCRTLPTAGLEASGMK